MPAGVIATIVAIALAALAWFLADRAVRGGALERAAERRAAERARLASDGGDSVASGALGDLMDVFQPQRVHLTAEMNRQKVVRQGAPDADPLALDLDLEDGTVWLGAHENNGDADHDGEPTDKENQ